MKAIPLTKGYFALVDDDDFAILSQCKWTAQEAPDTVYAYRQVQGKKIYMHRVVLGVDATVHVDHWDGDGLNNQKANLRRATVSQNLANQKLSRANTSGFKGVVWDKERKKWRAQIKVNQRMIWLGRFDDIEHAKTAYATAAEVYFGEFSRLH